MASTERKITLHVRLPMWWRAYWTACLIFSRLGGTVDLETFKARVQRHTRYYQCDEAGKLKRLK